MQTRRESLGHGLAVMGLLAGAGLWPGAARAFNKSAFEARSVAEAVKAYGGQPPAESAQVSITGPEIAENGASVLLAAATTLPNVKQLLVLVEKNPNALAAKFDLTEFVEPNFSLRVKMAESSQVYAVAITADNRAHFARREIKVTLGGCG
jgi:sulfur-oxidizing protein SoxY